MSLPYPAITRPIIDEAILKSGYECPAFDRAFVSTGTAPRGSAVPLGQSPIEPGVIEFRHRETGTVLASMSTETGTVLNQSVSACRVAITPASLAARLGNVLEVAVYSDVGLLPVRGIFNPRSQVAGGDGIRRLVNYPWRA